MAELRNLVSQAELKKRLEADPTPRRTLSFYRYHAIAAPRDFRDELYLSFEKLGVLGRVYVAKEGINAQISVPDAQLDAFKTYLETHEWLRGVRLNFAADDDGKSFWVLNVKVRDKIVADGIDDPDFSMQRTGKYLSAAQFNELALSPETVVVDMRNSYEFEVGHFQNALEVPSDTFRQQLPLAAKLLDAQRDKNIVMYCTGGIRCEKASAYLLHRGFQNVFHLEGGVLEYTRQVREQNLENRFRGKNFVFDGRLGERIGEEIISRCHGCDALCDTHRNCANDDCHLLFLQCETCAQMWQGCCCAECLEWKDLAPAQREGRQFHHAEGHQNRRVRFFDMKRAD